MSLATTASSLYVGFDYGRKRIGVAIGDDLTGQARPLATLRNVATPDWQGLQRLLETWSPRALVVGLPVDLDGNAQPMTRHAEQFAKALRQRYGLPVHFCDERLSSRAADDEIRNARADGRKPRRSRKGDRDSMAARLILEQWLQSALRADELR